MYDFEGTAMTNKRNPIVTVNYSNLAWMRVCLVNVMHSLMANSVTQAQPICKPKLKRKDSPNCTPYTEWTRFVQKKFWDQQINFIRIR
jgi:hypothetical protein